MRSVELFAGAGGLALGSALAGFHHRAVIEWDENACETIRENQRRGFRPVVDWPLHQKDAGKFDYSSIRDNIDVLIAGPPCQPFSLGGKHGSIADSRNMFPEVARALRELRPRAFLVENVRGLLRPSFAKHFEYILLQLAHPETWRREDEQWSEHLSRLERHETKGRRDGLFYRLVFRSVNAADYGVPQRRARVFIVGFRMDVNAAWSFPPPTHSFAALLKSQWIDGEYWERHEVPLKRRPSLPASLQSRVAELRHDFCHLCDKPWATVRDTIAGLPNPLKSKHAATVENHRFQAGARPYPGHTGSPLDMPAKALKAGDHGVPGGENMLAHPDGQVRYFTVRESARLQCFPDDYVFCGSWTESMRQLGNAVPVTLGQTLASSIRAGLET